MEEQEEGRGDCHKGDQLTRPFWEVHPAIPEEAVEGLPLGDDGGIQREPQDRKSVV